MPSKRVEDRNRLAERESALDTQARAVGAIAAARADGSLGEEIIKLAQAIIMCTLPYSRTDETEIQRSARLGDGSTLTVTFQALEANHGVPMPFGADRHLLAWIFDRAITSQSPFISWESASEYRREMGLSTGGSGLRQLTQRFTRLSALMIKIERSGEINSALHRYPLVEKQFLPKSITGKTLEREGQTVLPELRGRYGFQLSNGLYEDIIRHHIVLPRKLWRELEGSSLIQDLVYWLCARCYAARSLSRIPWDAIQQQFPQDKNPRRFKANVVEAVRLLKMVWPKVQLKVHEDGLEVDYTREPMLQDDPTKNRQRRLTAD